MNQVPAVLAIGGLDPTGGAGLLIDAAAIRAAGAHPACLTAVLTVQSGKEFCSSMPIPASHLEEAFRAVRSGITISAIKTGSLGTRAIIEVVARLVDELGVPLVVDPVLCSSTGGALFDQDAEQALVELLLPRAALLTPNLMEAARLADMAIEDVDGMIAAARVLVARGPQAVLIKGGHLPGEHCVDVLVDTTCASRLSEMRLQVGEVRGTGCCLASAIAARLAIGHPPAAAVRFGRILVRKAMARAYAAGPSPLMLGL